MTDLALPRQTIMHNLHLLLSLQHRLELIQIARPRQVYSQVPGHFACLLHYVPEIIRPHPIEIENPIIPIPGASPGRAQEYGGDRRLPELRDQGEEVAADEGDLCGYAVDAGIVARAHYSEGVEVDCDDFGDLGG